MTQFVIACLLFENQMPAASIVTVFLWCLVLILGCVGYGLRCASFQVFIFSYVGCSIPSPRELLIILQRFILHFLCWSPSMVGLPSCIVHLLLFSYFVEHSVSCCFLYLIFFCAKLIHFGNRSISLHYCYWVFTCSKLSFAI